MSRWTLLLCSCGTLAGCGQSSSGPAAVSTFEPTDPQLLSTGSPTKDEDPSVVRARDGSMHVAWFSDRGGNPDIYVTRTADGKSWAAPTRVTTDPGGDFNPSLLQDDQGTFHLVWFRWEALFRGHIWYNSSADGITWNPASEVSVTTTANVDDWVPTLTRAIDGTLLVYFVSDAGDGVNPTNEIYVAVKRPGAANWDAAVPAAGINSSTEHDHLPFAARTGNEVTLVWVRHDTTEPLPWLNAKSDLVYATSANGVTWSPPARITNDSGRVVNLFPGLFPTLDGRWSFVWLSTRTGSPRVFELPLADAGRYPAAVVENPLLPAGYSHRIAPTTTPGVYLAAWVQGPEGSQDIYYRFFRK